MPLYLLFESATGYALFKREESEEIGDQLDEVQRSIVDFGKFRAMVSLVSFEPFKLAEDALENANAVSEGQLHDTLRDFLERNLPLDGKKKKNVTLGIQEEKLATTVQDALGCKVKGGSLVQELIRGVRLHFARFIKQFKTGDVEKAQLGLSHAYSRSKVKFNVNRVDNHIIQSINLLDQLDKDVNTFAMRAREWYSWHFPELVKIVPDNLQFAKCIEIVQDRASINEETKEAIRDLLSDDDKAKAVIDAANTSMGTDISEYDMANILHFSRRVVSLCTYRDKLHHYLTEKMDSVAPNLKTLIGDHVGARLIAHAGSLTNLAKYPASTVQILGAEKALFRALKSRGNTPKYGLIFHSPYIGRASAKNKGRVSRYLANKCSIAARLDCFLDTPTNVFGEKLREQVEERLEFYDSGHTPRKNIDVMTEAKQLAEEQSAVAAESQKKKKKKAKKAKEEEAVVETPRKKKKKTKAVEEDEEPVAEKKDKKKKKKRQREEEDDTSSKRARVH